MSKRVLCAIAAVGFMALAGAPSAQADYNFQVFAGYRFPEELDEDLAYGLRFGGRPGEYWGWEVSGEWFDVADSQGFGGRNVDADIFNVDGSLKYYPGGGDFNFFGGIGLATVEIKDIPGQGNLELSDDVFSVNAGVGYDIRVGESFFVPLDARARWYELEGFGGPGGKQSQIDFTASVGLGWKFGQ